MELDRERLIQEVAARWGLVISKDDPIIGAVALNDVVLDLHMGRLSSALEDQSTRLDSLNQQQINASKQIAKKIIGEALALATTEIRQQAKQTQQQTDQAVGDQIKALGAALDDRAALKRQLMWAWSTAGFLGLLLVVVLLMVA
ncbi:hypothetical protein [Sedimenticola thiotaurini]|uniref:Conjugal transfer protein TraM n=1 Tax=Sedimenticola thiotaurini TaxID=1543721 RepID=A0A0F7K566_9GAMM|nr:hypothetical protein [Sedimenticola thiotaurini]AKH22390.1 hypothetical protein AAY24_18170 [Sedimenticola thiotaurini]